MNIGLAILLEIRKRGTTQTKVAKDAALTDPALSKIIKGGSPMFDSVRRIARALGLKTSELVRLAEKLEE